MATTRRVSWFRALLVHQELVSGIRQDNDENVNPMLGDELETVVQERRILVRCPPRRHPRIPLRDITHLFPGNVAPLDDKTDPSPPVLRQARGNGRVRRPLPSASPQISTRKRRQAEPASETSTERRILRKFR